MSDPVNGVPRLAEIGVPGFLPVALLVLALLRVFTGGHDAPPYPDPGMPKTLARCVRPPQGSMLLVRFRQKGGPAGRGQV